MSMADTPAQVALDELGLGDIVETAKGAKFWGEIIAFDTDGTSPGCTVRAIDPGFEGTKHVYPLKQLRRRALSSLSGEAGDDGQGALVERARYFVENPSAWESGFDQGASDRLAEILAAYDALTRENAALRRDLDRYRDGLQVLATTYYKGDEHQDYAKHVLGNDAAERRLAEQGQAQGEAVVELAAQAMYELKPFHGLDNRPDPIPWREYARYNPGLADGLRQQARAALSCATPPSPEQGQAHEAVSDKVIATIWTAAMTVACNIVIKRQNDLNDDDGPMDVVNEQGAIIATIKKWLEPDEPYLEELRRMLPATPPSPEPDAELVREINAIADMITLGNFYHQRQIGDLAGWCERTQKRIRALARHRKQGET